MAKDSEAAALVIGLAYWAAAELRAKRAVLLEQIRDGVAVAPVQPRGQGNENQPRAVVSITPARIVETAPLLVLGTTGAAGRRHSSGVCPRGCWHNRASLAR